MTIDNPGPPIPLRTSFNAMERQELRELTRINGIIDPWLESNIDREPWIVTLKTGYKVTILMPLGAAVDLEENHGYANRIEAGFAPPPFLQGRDYS